MTAFFHVPVDVDNYYAPYRFNLDTDGRNVRVPGGGAFLGILGYRIHLNTSTVDIQMRRACNCCQLYLGDGEIQPHVEDLLWMRGVLVLRIVILRKAPSSMSIIRC